MRDYEDKEKMPEEDVLSSQNNKGKKFCSEEDKISALLYLRVYIICRGKTHLHFLSS